MKSERVAKWDNLKVIMIFCVVLGHTLYEFIGKGTGTAKGIYLFIYTFHMPVFIFLTGMFAKNTIAKKRYDRVVEFLLIYLVMKFLDHLGRCLTAKTRKADFFSPAYLKEIREGLFSANKGFHLFWEDGPAWFALAVAVFLFLTIQVREMDARIVMTAAVLLGCLAGLDNHLGDHLASMRICTFYPVFLLGYYTDPRRPDEGSGEAAGHREGSRRTPGSRIGAGAARILSALGLGLVLTVCLMWSEDLYPRVNFLKGKTDYAALGLGVNGVILRLVCYGFWILMIFGVIALCPRREYFWTWLGKRTMSVFIWHKFILTLILKLFYGEYYIKYEMPHYYMFAAFCLAVTVTVITAYLPGFRLSGWTGTAGKKKAGRRTE